jgi:hypothetical protein
MSDLLESIYEAKYQDCRVWVFKARENQKTWNEIKFGCRGDEEGLKAFLKSEEETNFWDISLETWYFLIDSMKEMEAREKPGFIGDPNRPLLTPPTGEGSCWVKYKKTLKEPAFSVESRQMIEGASIKLVSQLCKTTEQNNPIRGIVVGNVQSGKTANMAGVIAMAADYGYNFFIVLSGTIDSLRTQTAGRLIGDLNSGNGSLHFTPLNNVSPKTPYPNRLQDLFLDNDSTVRYLDVCLKNSSRLKDLQGWLEKFPEKKAKLKILLIDDEADQAGINTANISKQQITMIFSRIYQLVFAKNEKFENLSPYSCMNYIGYTATPYANFLNEASEFSLYPKNFIMTLQTPAEYIGPQQIFGYPGINVGLPIVNEISIEEIEHVKNKTAFENNDLPIELKHALFWFICTVAVYRYWKLGKPVSMLIHTSQRIENHASMAAAIENFLNLFKTDPTRVEQIKAVWDEQTSQLTHDTFLNEMTGYKAEIVKDYPLFDEIRGEIEALLNSGTTHITLGDNLAFQYNSGLHVCVDNCSNNSIEGDTVMRLVYPDDKNTAALDLCPAFIVIGGTTLSRGLTLKGLTCSYFLRTTEQADTLMQMGRWFGYRKQYELLPRLWLSRRVIEQFKRLTILDYDLRQELLTMEKLSLVPSQYGPRLDSFPDFRILKITSKNKMQSAYTLELDFANKRGQTTSFFKDPKIIQANYSKTIEFINKLGPLDITHIRALNNPISTKGKMDDTFIWFDQNGDTILDFIGSLQFPTQSATFGDISQVKEWCQKATKDGTIKGWDVVLSSVVKSKAESTIAFNSFVLGLPTRKKLNREDPEKIFLKTISAPSDFVIDIDTRPLTRFQIETIDESDERDFASKRVSLGMGETPLLILYIIDKDSGKGDPLPTNMKDKSARLPLALSQHLVGYYIYIPYGKISKDGAPISKNKITAKLKFDTGGDIDESK